MSARDKADVKEQISDMAATIAAGMAQHSHSGSRLREEILEEATSWAFELYNAVSRRIDVAARDPENRHSWTCSFRHDRTSKCDCTFFAD